MSKYALAAFLALYGVTVSFESFIPGWVPGILAWAAAATCIADAVKEQKKQP